MSRAKQRRPPASAKKKRPAPSKRPSDAAQPRTVAILVAVATVLVVGTLVSLAASEEGPTPVERDPSVVAAGMDLYNASCATCHGTDLRGTDTGPPFLVPTYAPNHHGDEAFQQAAALGVPPHHWGFGPMPPVAGLSRSDIALIVAYVRTEQETNGIFLDPAH